MTPAEHNELPPAALTERLIDAAIYAETASGAYKTGAIREVNEARGAIEVLLSERDRLREALSWYANPEIYKPHPHGPAFDDRDLSFHARSALQEGGK